MALEPNKNEQNNLVERCPHCGHKLSQWQQVILSVDRVLMCKNCWYRIILDYTTPDPGEEKPESEKE